MDKMRAPKARSANGWGPGAHLRAPGGVQGQSPWRGSRGRAPRSCRVLGFLGPKITILRHQFWVYWQAWYALKIKKKQQQWTWMNGAVQRNLRSKHKITIFIWSKHMIWYHIYWKGKDMHHNVKFQGWKINKKNKKTTIKKLFHIKFQVLWLVSLYQITDLSFRASLFREFHLFTCESTCADCRINNIGIWLWKD